MTRKLTYALLAVVLACSAREAQAQSAPANTVPSALVTVHVRRDSGNSAIEFARVQSGATNVRTDANGDAFIRLLIGSQTVTVTKLGFRPDSATLEIRLGADTSIVISLVEHSAEIETVMVTSTRSERRVEDTPIRVEVIDEEEMAEKVAMAPGDISMMLNETSGLRVQSTNPSLGGANVRIQGLRGRYSLILGDGLPMYGGQAGGLGLLQIPPVDLVHVEIIKGTASALYGSSALGGVIDLISKRPGDALERTALINQTTRNGTDAVFYVSSPLGNSTGATLLASANRQQRTDTDNDGWTDIPGYDRVVVRPRLFLDDHKGHSAFVTAGFTGENRVGGTIDGRVTPDGTGYVESLRTRKGDFGALARWVLPNEGVMAGSILTVRGSGVEQRHAHQFGLVKERDEHRTWFTEAAIAIPRGKLTYVAGTAFQQERYNAKDVAGFNYTYNIPSAFAQVDVDANTWFALSASARADAHSDYGTFVNPRVSLLFRSPSEVTLTGWTARLSGGTGAFAPTPFVEETEVTGLAPLRPLAGLVAERALSGSFDVGGPVQFEVGRVELNATLFASQVQHPLQVAPFGNAQMTLLNGAKPIQTLGSELLARFTHNLGEDNARTFRVTGTYTLMQSTECEGVDPTLLQLRTSACTRQSVALTPRQSASIVSTIEREGVSRVGIELYYTGKQRLEYNPYRSVSRPYVIVGLMGERALKTPIGTARLFLNLENLTNVRQTKYDALLLPARGLGGRWTTDAWTDLNGFTTNGGVRFVW